MWELEFTPVKPPLSISPIPAALSCCGDGALAQSVFNSGMKRDRSSSKKPDTPPAVHNGMDAGLLSFDSACTTALTSDLDRIRRMQLGWLIALALGNGAALLLDVAVLPAAELWIAYTLRLAVVTPLAMLALVINRTARLRRWREISSATVSISVVFAVTIVSQFALDPFSSRYMMAALFVVLLAPLFAGLSLPMARATGYVSTLVFAVIVASGLMLPPAMTNLDLIGFAVVLTLGGLRVRRQRDAQISELSRMRQLYAERAMELAAANLKLLRLSNTDPLTGAYNRRYLDEAIARDATSLVPSLTRAVLMIDVDHFKRFNDYSGHPEGDRCLRSIASALREILRSTDDVLVRYGGEEFVVVLSQISREETLALAERLRAAVSRLKVPHPGLGSDAVVSVSIGVHYGPASGNFAEKLKSADRMLYAAKQAGRNQVAA
jgi:diguanylate cyclase (GGDEF)-like protein